MTPEQHADNIAKWNNAGLRQAVIDEIAAAVAEEREACAEWIENQAAWWKLDESHSAARHNVLIGAASKIRNGVHAAYYADLRARHNDNH